MGKVPCTETLDFLGIAKLAGSSCDETIRFDGEYLYVSDVEQEALEQALVEFDPLPGAKTYALAMINTAYEAEFAAIKQQYPESERLSWPLQLAEAKDLAVDPQAETPFLDDLLLDRGFGETREELAAKVRAKSQAYRKLSTAMTGKRHRLERQVLESTTVEEVQGIVWG